MTMTCQNGYRPMSNKLDSQPASGQRLFYQIRLRGHLSHAWEEWFEGLTITLEDNGETLLAGPVIDQAALHGLLRKVRDLGMPLVSVNRDESSGVGPVRSEKETK